MTARLPRCPKCRCRRLLLTEWQGVQGEIEQHDDGRLGGDSRTLEFTDSHVSHVTAQCRGCDYFWKLRGIKQITDHPGHAWNRKP